MGMGISHNIGNGNGKTWEWIAWEREGVGFCSIGWHRQLPTNDYSFHCRPTPETAQKITLGRFRTWLSDYSLVTENH